MKSTKLLIKRLKESEVETTPYINEALWLLADGTMLSGEFDLGTRGQDHRIIFCGVAGAYGSYYESNNPAVTHWNRIHKDYRVVRLCPESNIALVKGKQQLTAAQAAALHDTLYVVESY